MNPVAIETNAFLHAQVVQTIYDADGGACTDIALWWRLNHQVPGATWHLSYYGTTPGGPAVVDDFGDLVLAGVRP